MSRSHVLYHHPFSICSLMVRYTWALRGAPQSPSMEMELEEHTIDIFNYEQLEEIFLCEINPKGQVPVLAGGALSTKPIPDSMEITKYFAERYPELIPSAHEDEINRYLKDLHHINYFSLSFTTKPQIPQAIKAKINKLLEETDSSRYRKALEYKLSIIEKDKIGGLEPEVVDKNINATKSLLSALDSEYHPQHGPWLFGLERPTALDAHLVMFMARLRDVGRQILIPRGLQDYLDAATSQTEFQCVTTNGRTMIGK